jgi:hypothetical protein
MGMFGDLADKIRSGYDTARENTCAMFELTGNLGDFGGIKAGSTAIYAPFSDDNDEVTVFALLGGFVEMMMLDADVKSEIASMQNKLQLHLQGRAEIAAAYRLRLSFGGGEVSVVDKSPCAWLNLEGQLGPNPNVGSVTGVALCSDREDEIECFIGAGINVRVPVPSPIPGLRFGTRVSAVYRHWVEISE